MGTMRGFEAAGPLERLWLMVERGFNAGIESRYNPFYYLGAIGIFFLWIILVSGIYLFLFYSISASGAYESVRSLTEDQWYLGGVMRSMHRYASDGLVVVMVLHGLRTFVLDRFRHWRWISWVTGVVMAWVVWIGGIFGYWMVWDEKAKLVALFSSTLLENIPIFGLPLSLNFARAGNVTDQFFYIILFIHFTSIFVLFILILLHLGRIAKAVITPPKAVIYGLMLSLLVFSALMPAESGPAADLKALPQSIGMDWFYMFVFPLLKYLQPYQTWGFVVAATLAIAAAPWIAASKRRQPVEVNLPNCTGCEQCMEDCPYLAIQMRKRTDGLSYDLEAVVTAKKCASCGICVGSCDYKALDLPDMTEESVKALVRGYITDMKEGVKDGPSVMVFACARGALSGASIDKEGRLAGCDWARVVSLPCIGMLQPSMLSMPIDRGIDGVYVASCRKGDCHYRRGIDWFEGRLGGLRPPIVRKSIDRARISHVDRSAVEKEEFLSGLERFRSALKGIGRS